MMKPKVFVSKPDIGWSEVEVPDKFSNYSHQALVCVVHQFVRRQAYQGLLITENPDPFSI